MSNTNSNHLPVPVASGALTAANGQPTRRPRPQPAAPEASLDWSRITAALLRFKWLIVLCVVLGGVAGQLSLRFVPPQYSSQATIVIDQPDRRGGGGDATAPFRAGESFSPEAWIMLLRSFTVLDTVVIQRHMYLSAISPISWDSSLVASFAVANAVAPGSYRLAVDPEGRNYSLSHADGNVIERGALGSPIGARLGFKWAPPASAFAPGTTYVFSVRSPRTVALGLQNVLKPTIDADGNFLRIEYQSGSPTSAAATLNAIADRFVAVAADLKRQNIVARAQILSDQLSTASKNLTAAEHAAEHFRVETVTLPRTTAGRGGVGDDRGTPNPAVDTYLGLQEQADQYQRDRVAMEKVLTAAGDSGINVVEMELLPPVKAVPALVTALEALSQKRQDIKVLRLKYTDSWPAVQKLQGEIALLEQNTIPVLTERIITDLRAREADAKLQAAGKLQDMRDIPPRLIEDARLERNRLLAEGLFNTLRQRYEEAQLAASASLSDVRVLDRAMPPQSPDRNLALRMLLMAILGGLGVGCLAAVLLDRVDPKFRYPEQVSREMGLTILGAIPHVRLNGSSGKVSQDGALFLEALRGIRMNLAYAYGSAGPLVFTLSSPGGADGKSFLASNLSRVFADSGRRTLLIDADLRRGRLHHRLGLQRRPGLTDFLRGDASVDRIIQSTKFPNFDLVTSGTRVHEAPELLSTSLMGQLLAELKARYEVIMFDSPPLAAGIDPFLLAALTGNLLLVLRTGVSLREVAEAKLEVLGRMPVRLLGAVLNDVPSTSAYQYYSNYLPGYDTSDESGGAAHHPILA